MIQKSEKVKEDKNKKIRVKERKRAKKKSKQTHQHRQKCINSRQKKNKHYKPVGTLIWGPLVLCSPVKAPALPHWYSAGDETWVPSHHIHSAPMTGESHTHYPLGLFRLSQPAANKYQWADIIGVTTYWFLSKTIRRKKLCYNKVKHPQTILDYTNTRFFIRTFDYLEMFIKV